MLFRSHALTERLREHRQLRLGDAQGREPGVREGDVQPARLGRCDLDAAPRPRATEQVVEREHLLGRRRLVDERRQPGPGAVGVAQPEEEQSLVVLVEPGEDVALDLGKVDLGVGAAGGLAAALIVRCVPPVRAVARRIVGEGAP